MKYLVKSGMTTVKNSKGIDEAACQQITGGRDAPFLFIGETNE